MNQRESFLLELRNGGVAALSATVPGDMLTPVSAYRALRGLSSASFLLESVEGGEHLARYSFLGLDPALLIESAGGRAVLRRPGREPVEGGSLLDEAGRVLESYRVSASEDPVPLRAGGLVGFIGYDEVRTIERLPRGKADPLGAPDSLLGLFGSIVVFDHLTHRVRVVVSSVSDASRDPGSRAEGGEALFDRMTRRLSALRAALRYPTGAGTRPEGSAPAFRAGEIRFDLSRFSGNVRRALEHIRDGDIFQVVLSERAVADFTGDPFEAYRALRMINPSPYHFFMDFDGTALLGSSPEMLARLTGDSLEHVPIAGTRPRGRTKADDAIIAGALLADPKEIAEHVMLVDLGRNDLSRVCRPGSVSPDRLMTVERYSHVMHLVSHVAGTTLPGVGAIDVLKAVFPAGTVSGAPKIRAMEIIDDLETCRRGFYAGAAGYFDLCGNMDFCLAIRTMLARNGKLHFQAGAGIVAQSDPAGETEEIRHKIMALFEAVEAAGEIDG